MPSADHPVGGRCLCGGVTYEITLPFRRANHCHCSRCRKHTGSTTGVQGRVPREGFRLLSGRNLIKTWQPKGGKTKAFCGDCGSSLFGGDWPEGDEVSIRFGTLDDDPGIRPQYHSFTDSIPPWDEILDELPQYAQAKPSAEHFTLDDRGFFAREGPAKLRGEAYCNKKLCFTSLTAEPLFELLYELSLRDDCYFVKLDSKPGAHGMIRGRCFLTSEDAVAALWKRYKVTPKLLCTVQDDDFTNSVR